MSDLTRPPRQPPQGAWALLVRLPRPLAMWVCVLGLVLFLVVTPAARLLGVQVPDPDWAGLNLLVQTLLGLGAMRSIDKMLGNAT